MEMTSRVSHKKSSENFSLLFKGLKNFKRGLMVNHQLNCTLGSIFICDSNCI